MIVAGSFPDVKVERIRNFLNAQLGETLQPWAARENRRKIEISDCDHEHLTLLIERSTMGPTGSQSRASLNQKVPPC